MATLNRFPLLGLWAKEVARRLGYTVTEAESLGHAYAVLYAIRAAGGPKHTKGDGGAAAATASPAAPPAKDELAFGGDRLEVVREGGKVRGRVGGAEMQTPQSYRYHVVKKFPAGSYDKLEAAFRRVLATYKPGELNSRLTYQLYDEWKKSCGAGRLVDLDKLTAWCDKRAADRARSG
jgi:hypothetical protein